MSKIKIESVTEKNCYYRNVIFTTKEMQVVLMSLPVNSDIPIEKHKKTTQYIKVEIGEITVQIYDKSKNPEKKIIVKEGESVIIPENTYHYVKNSSKTSTHLYSIYSPPEHPPNLIQKSQPPQFRSPLNFPQP